MSKLPTQAPLASLRERLAQDPAYVRDARELAAAYAKDGDFDHARAIAMVVAERVGVAPEAAYAAAFRDHLASAERAQNQARVSQATLAAITTKSSEATTEEQRQSFVALASEMLVHGDAGVFTPRDFQAFQGLVQQHVQHQANKVGDTVHAVHENLSKLASKHKEAYNDMLAELKRLGNDEKGIKDLSNKILAKASMAELQRRAQADAHNRAQTWGETAGALGALATITKSRELTVTAALVQCAGRVDMAVRSASSAIAAGGLAAMHPLVAIVGSVMCLASVLDSGGPDPMQQGFEQLSQQIAELRSVVVNGFRALTERLDNVSVMIQSMERDLNAKLDRMCDSILRPIVVRLDSLIALAEEQAAAQDQRGACKLAKAVRDARDILLEYGPGRARDGQQVNTETVAAVLSTLYRAVMDTSSSSASSSASSSGGAATLRSVLRVALNEVLATSSTSSSPGAPFKYAPALHKWFVATPGAHIATEPLMPRNSNAAASNPLVAQARRASSDAAELASALRARGQGMDPVDAVRSPDLVRRIGNATIVIPRGVWRHDARKQLGASRGAVYAGSLAVASAPSASTALPLRGTVPVAVKVVDVRDLSVADTSEDVRDALKELDTLRRLRGHPNIIHVHGVSWGADVGLALVMELGIGSLSSEMRAVYASGRTLDPASRVGYLTWLSGLAYAHENGVVHRDIKPENVIVFIKPGGTIVCKLADFGISKAVGTTRTTSTRSLREAQADAAAGTEAWKAAEVVCGRNHSQASDTFSAALVALVVLLNGRPIHGRGPGLLPLDQAGLFMYYFTNQLSARSAASALKDLVEANDPFAAAVQRTLSEPAFRLRVDADSVPIVDANSMPLIDEIPDTVPRVRSCLLYTSDAADD